MQVRLWTVHAQPSSGPGEVWLVTDRFRFWAFLLPPVWAVVAGYWVALVIALGLQLLVSVAVALTLGPAAATAFFFGVMVLFGWEAGAIARLDLWVRGWRIVGLAEAETEEGAAEQWLEGHGVSLRRAEAPA